MAFSLFIYPVKLHNQNNESSIVIKVINLIGKNLFKICTFFPKKNTLVNLRFNWTIFFTPFQLGSFKPFFYKEKNTQGLHNLCIHSLVVIKKTIFFWINKKTHSLLYANMLQLRPSRPTVNQWFFLKKTLFKQTFLNYSISRLSWKNIVNNVLNFGKFCYKTCKQNNVLKVTITEQVGSISRYSIRNI